MKLHSYDFEKIAKSLLQLEGISVSVPSIEVCGLRLILKREESQRGEVSVAVVGMQLADQPGRDLPLGRDFDG